MDVVLYLGCTIPTQEYAYEVSAREVLSRLGINLIDLQNAACCGQPLKGLDNLGWMYLASRTIALAEQQGAETLLALCNGCHVSICEAKHILESDDHLRETIEEMLAEEDLEIKGHIRIRHLLDFLHDDIGVQKIKQTLENVSNFRYFGNLKLAAHYGCHIIRPSSIERPDQLDDPSKLEALIEVTGASTAKYPERLECCGAPMLASADKESFQIAAKKLLAIQNRGFDGVITVCPFCERMLERQEAISRITGLEVSISSMYYTQLLGLALGVETEQLGIQLNMSSIEKILNKMRR
ncbi:MAG: CoB--CoM heterodisulfide reductase iron-sulfur subunit B family protein [Promethearchaeota archaeon]